MNTGNVELNKKIENTRKKRQELLTELAILRTNEREGIREADLRKIEEIKEQLLRMR